MQIKVKKLKPEAKIPTRLRRGDAGSDLCAIAGYLIKPGKTAIIETGIAMAIPTGYVGLIWDRSGLAIKNGLKVMGGVIDSNYRGEIKVGLANLSNKNYKIEAGERIAQILIQRIEPVTPVIVNKLPLSTRGDKGFGSSGKK